MTRDEVSFTGRRVRLVGRRIDPRDDHFPMSLKAGWLRTLARPLLRAWNRLLLIAQTDSGDALPRRRPDVRDDDRTGLRRTSCRCAPQHRQRCPVRHGLGAQRTSAVQARAMATGPIET